MDKALPSHQVAGTRFPIDICHPQKPNRPRSSQRGMDEQGRTRFPSAVHSSSNSGDNRSPSDEPQLPSRPLPFRFHQILKPAQSTPVLTSSASHTRDSRTQNRNSVVIGDTIYSAEQPGKETSQQVLLRELIQGNDEPNMDNHSPTTPQGRSKSFLRKILSEKKKTAGRPLQISEPSDPRFITYAPGHPTGEVKLERAPSISPEIATDLQRQAAARDPTTLEMQALSSRRLPAPGGPLNSNPSQLTMHNDPDPPPNFMTPTTIHSWENSCLKSQRVISALEKDRAILLSEWHYWENVAYEHSLEATARYIEVKDRQNEIKIEELQRENDELKMKVIEVSVTGGNDRAYYRHMVEMYERQNVKIQQLEEEIERLKAEAAASFPKYAVELKIPSDVDVNDASEDAVRLESLSDVDVNDLPRCLVAWQAAFAAHGLESEYSPINPTEPEVKTAIQELQAQSLSLIQPDRSRLDGDSILPSRSRQLPALSRPGRPQPAALTRDIPVGLGHLVVQNSHENANTYDSLISPSDTTQDQDLISPRSLPTFALRSRPNSGASTEAIFRFRDASQEAPSCTQRLAIADSTDHLVLEEDGFVGELRELMGSWERISVLNVVDGLKDPKEGKVSLPVPNGRRRGSRKGQPRTVGGERDVRDEGNLDGNGDHLVVPPSVYRKIRLMSKTSSM